MIDTVIFDLNNVAENYEDFKNEFVHHIISVLSNACELLNTEFNENVLCDLYKERLSIIDTIPFQHHPAFWQALFEDYLQRNLNYHEISKLYDSYLLIYGELIKCYPDFLEAIDLCKSRKFKMGIIANGNAKRIYRFLEKFDLIDKFDTIIASSATPFSKPNSSIFELAIFNLKSTPTQTIFIGDRLDNDISGSNRTGIWSVRLLRGTSKNSVPKELDEIPDYCIENLTEVFDAPFLNNDNFISDVVIPCGGRGKRMGDLTDNNSKCLLPDHECSILKVLSELLVRCGVKTIHLLLGYNSNKIMDYCSSLNSFNVTFKFHNVQKESTGQALYFTLEELPESFVYCHGNILFPPALFFKLQKKYYSNNRKSVFVVTSKRVAETHPVFALDNGNVTAIERYDRDLKETSPFYSVGLSIINKNDINCLIQESPKRKITTEQLFTKLLKKINVLIYDEGWYHLENKEDLKRYKGYSKKLKFRMKYLNLNK